MSDLPAMPMPVLSELEMESTTWRTWSKPKMYRINRRMVIEAYDSWPDTPLFGQGRTWEAFKVWIKWRGHWEPIKKWACEKEVPTYSQYSTLYSSQAYALWLLLWYKYGRRCDSD